MKKEYENPKAEKMEFDYSEAVVASGCSGGITVDYIDGYTDCGDTPVKKYNGYGNNEN